MNLDLNEAITALEKEKGISRDALLDVIELSLIAACKNHFGKSDNVKVTIDRDTCDYDLYMEKEVVEDGAVEDPVLQIGVSEAKRKNSALTVGDIYRQPIQSKEFGRIAAQNAKSLILQKIREEEKRTVHDQFAAKLHKVVTGTIQRQVGSNISINLGKADALLAENEQVSTELYEPKQRIKVYVLEVKTTNRGTRIMVSRTHPELVKCLFEQEVTELQNGTIEIKAIAREPGSRTKMAVWSNDPDVDPIGACVGVNGTRVSAVVDELHGEKIDIIHWSDNSAELIENAISPAKVIAVLADDDEKTALVVVPDYQLSLAIGRIGQNARLAARLTGYKIDIKSETQARESGLFDEIGYIEDYYYDDEEEPEEGYEEEAGEEYEWTEEEAGEEVFEEEEQPAEGADE